MKNDLQVRTIQIGERRIGLWRKVNAEMYSGEVVQGQFRRDHAGGSVFVSNSGKRIDPARIVGARYLDDRESRSNWVYLLQHWDAMAKAAGFEGGYSVLGIRMLDRLVRNRRAVDAITRQRLMMRKIKGLSREEKQAAIQKRIKELESQLPNADRMSTQSIASELRDCRTVLKRIEYKERYMQSEKRKAYINSPEQREKRRLYKARKRAEEKEKRNEE